MKNPEEKLKNKLEDINEHINFGTKRPGEILKEIREARIMDTENRNIDMLNLYDRIARAKDNRIDQYRERKRNY